MKYIIIVCVVLTFCLDIEYARVEILKSFSYIEMIFQVLTTVKQLPAHMKGSVLTTKVTSDVAA